MRGSGSSPLWGTRTKRAVWHFAAVFPARLRHGLPAGAANRDRGDAITPRGFAELSQPVIHENHRPRRPSRVVTCQLGGSFGERERERGRGCAVAGAVGAVGAAVPWWPWQGRAPPVRTCVSVSCGMGGVGGGGIWHGLASSRGDQGDVPGGCRSWADARAVEGNARAACDEEDLEGPARGDRSAGGAGDMAGRRRLLHLHRAAPRGPRAFRRCARTWGGPYGTRTRTRCRTCSTGTRFPRTTPRATSGSWARSRWPTSGRRRSSGTAPPSWSSAPPRATGRCARRGLLTELTHESSQLRWGIC